jgi:hypothetical protein
MMGHTRGPWEVERKPIEGNGGIYCEIIAPILNRSGVIADTLNRDAVITDEEDYANALLMAASKDLLAMCEELAATISTFGSDPRFGLHCMMELLPKVEATIQKARKGE